MCRSEGDRREVACGNDACEELGCRICGENPMSSRPSAGLASEKPELITPHRVASSPHRPQCSWCRKSCISGRLSAGAHEQRKRRRVHRRGHARAAAHCRFHCAGVQLLRKVVLDHAAQSASPLLVHRSLPRLPAASGRREGHSVGRREGNAVGCGQWWSSVGHRRRHAISGVELELGRWARHLPHHWIPARSGRWHRYCKH